MSSLALVTGGTSGIGRACVERLRRDGYTVVFTGRDAGRGAAVAAATGATFLRCDARDRAQIAGSVARAHELGGGRIDLLVGNAGVLIAGSIAETPLAAFRELVEVNLTALFLYSRACFALMREQGSGSLVHISSDTGIRGIHELAAYSVTKAGAVMLSELFAGEGARHGVRANAICPGDVEPGVQATPVGHEHDAEDPAGWDLPPNGRFGTGQDIAAAVAWLASPEAAHITGATLRIDGGANVVLRARS